MPLNAHCFSGTVRRSGSSRRLARFALACVLATAGFASAQEPRLVTVIPDEIDDVLLNPGMGFQTFQRFNGDPVEPPGGRWTEGFPLRPSTAQPPYANKDYPQTSAAYHRLYWRFLEPDQPGKYRWDLIDDALRLAAERGQTLLLRLAPYGPGPDPDRGGDPGETGVPAVSS